MSRLIVRSPRGTGGIWFVVAELLMQCLLLLVAAYVLRDMGLLRVEPAAILVAGMVVYWMFRTLGRDRIAFWLMAPTVTFPHVAAAWSHNRIEWQELLDIQEGLVDDRSVYWDVGFFVACLSLLVALHRIIGIRRLNRQMVVQQVDRPERGAVVRREAILIIGLLLPGVLTAGAAFMFLALLEPNDRILQSVPSQLMATIGGGAAILLASTLLLWFRGLIGARDQKSGILLVDMTASRQDTDHS